MQSVKKWAQTMRCRRTRVHSGSASRTLQMCPDARFDSKSARSLATLTLVFAFICTSALGQDAEDPVPAFPGAEGFGALTRGGRGGRVIHVTQLGDSGPGSLRSAIDAEGPRTVVFDVSGTIDLERPLTISNGFVTVAGQTARASGITLRQHGLTVAADEVIVRYLRVRPGDGSGEATDAIWIASGRNIILDHCSTSWASDETLSVSPRDKLALRPIDRVTVQWSIISESLNKSVHEKGEHGYGSLVRGSAGARYSFHHNLWAHHKARMPRPGNYVNAGTDADGPLFDFRNNVFYNWGGSASGYNADKDSVSRYNFVNNAFLTGPNSGQALAFREQNALSRLHFAGNLMNGELPADPWSLVEFEDGRNHGSDAPFDSAPVTTRPADQAQQHVLARAGATHARDPVDARVVTEVLERGGHIIDHPDQVGGWPALAPATPITDSDGDGMPDAWELRTGLDPDNPEDGKQDPDGDGYTYLEDYLNELATPGMLP